MHRKEDFVYEGYPNKKKFTRLTKQEERLGLYEDTSKISTRKQWELLLKEKKLQRREKRLKKDLLEESLQKRDGL